MKKTGWITPFPRITAAGKTVTHQSTFGDARYDKQHYATLSLHQYLVNPSLLLAPKKSA
jgi:hypothetical protein